MPADSSVSLMTAADRQLCIQTTSNNQQHSTTVSTRSDGSTHTHLFPPHTSAQLAQTSTECSLAALFGDRLELQGRLPNIHNSLYRNPCRQPVTQNTYFRRIVSYHPAWRRKDRGNRISWRVRSHYYLLHPGWIQRADAQPRRGPVMAAHSKQMGKR